LELIMNTKLIYIARHTSRGGTVHRLKPTIFWFGAKGPWYAMLDPSFAPKDFILQYVSQITGRLCA